MSDDRKHCPSHPRFLLDSCPVCERRISRAEDARSGLWTEEDIARGELEYERYVERWGEG